ncbi:MAG TPA: amidohydrolase family protein [Candidatus Binataceae bacterium]|jgi:imidazolonepropionase-like amidohydrolase|nr:amidohydrolase family protein [Candidatus Binataceae bacterium]
MGRIFFTAANLIDGVNPPQPNTTVVVEGDRIAAVGTGGGVPQPAARDTVFDLGGRTLMPGMNECHFHAGYNNINSTADIELKHPPTYLALAAARNAELLLRSGFTGAVGAGSPHNIDVALKDAIRDGLIQGPRLIACGHDISTTGGPVDTNPDFWKLGLEGLCHVCDGPEDFRKAIRREIKNGADIIKLYVTGGHGFEMAATEVSMTFEEIQAAAQAAHDRGRMVRGHVVSRRAIMDCLKARMDLIDHADAMDDECIDLMVKQGTYVTPSLYFSWKTMEFMRKRMSAQWLAQEERWLEQGYRAVEKANKAGVKLVIGDDFGTSWMPHGTYAVELDFYVKFAGTSPLDVIRWATRNGAGLLGLGDQIGTIEAGKIADLLVVNGDPVRDMAVLQDRAKLDVVMKDGQFIESHLQPGAASVKAA